MTDHNIIDQIYSNLSDLRKDYRHGQRQIFSVNRDVIRKFHDFDFKNLAQRKELDREPIAKFDHKYILGFHFPNISEALPNRIT
jgi:hypothetical protein